MKAWTIKTHRFTRKVEVNSLDYYSFTYEGTWVYLTLIQNWFECVLITLNNKYIDVKFGILRKQKEKSYFLFLRQTSKNKNIIFGGVKNNQKEYLHFLINTKH